jgi:hypothetical protein
MVHAHVANVPRGRPCELGYRYAWYLAARFGHQLCTGVRVQPQRLAQVRVNGFSWRSFWSVTCLLCDLQ